MLAHNHTYGLYGQDEDQYHDFLGLGKKGKARRKARRARRKERREIKFERRRLKNDDRRADTEIKRNEIKVSNALLTKPMAGNTPVMASAALPTNTQASPGQPVANLTPPAPQQAGISTPMIIGVAAIVLVGGYFMTRQKQAAIPLPVEA